jgi:hypothetical protein
MARVNVLPLTVGHREVLLIRAIVINACARLPLPAPGRADLFCRCRAFSFYAKRTCRRFDGLSPHAGPSISVVVYADVL